MNGGPYHDMHEPWWPSAIVVRESDMEEAVTNMAKRFPSFRPSNLYCGASNYLTSSAKIVDTAIAHALREAYRN